MMYQRYALLTLLASLVIVGCSPLAPRPDRSTYFLLTPLAKVADAPAASSPRQALTIGVGPIDFPDYLRRTQIVTRTEANQIELSPDARWAEPLDKNFERTLTENLSALLQTQRIERYPWPRRNRVDYQIVINVVRFETNANGQAQLVARWIIKDGTTGKDLYATETNASNPVATNASGASALSMDLEQLSSSIASQIDELYQRRNDRSG
jgi:uncharacterized protein